MQLSHPSCDPSRNLGLSHFFLVQRPTFKELFDPTVFKRSQDAWANAIV